MYYSIAWIQLLSVFIFLLTQTTCVFAYDWAVRQGFQATAEDLGGDIMVQNGRAYGASDTILYIPLLCSSAFGLFFKKRWSLICTAASAGISSYWSATSYFLLLFASRQVEDFSYEPDAATWTLIVFYFLYGILVLTFLYHYWDTLNRVMND